MIEIVNRKGKGNEPSFFGARITINKEEAKKIEKMVVEKLPQNPF